MSLIGKTMNYEIKHLEKDLWKDYMIPLNYASEFYYDVEMKQKEDSFQIELNKKKFDVPCEHKVPDKLYQDWCDKACAWGIEENGTLLAVIETAEESWNNRLRITELWVDEKLRRKGIGEMLMKETFELARKAGYPGSVILGEPDYYPRVGFRTCDLFGITTPDGKNFDAFMGYELQTDGLKDIHGKFYENKTYCTYLNVIAHKTQVYQKKWDFSRN